MNEAAPVKAEHAMMENRSNSSWQGGGEDQKGIWQIWNPADFVFDSRDCRIISKIRWIEGHDQRIAGMAELGGGMNGNRAISWVPLNSKLRLHNLQYVWSPCPTYKSSTTSDKNPLMACLQPKQKENHKGFHFLHSETTLKEWGWKYHKSTKFASIAACAP